METIFGSQVSRKTDEGRYFFDEGMLWCCGGRGYLCGMWVAYDAKRAFHNSSGLGNYSRRLIRAVAAARPDWGRLLYTGGAGSVPEARGLCEQAGARCHAGRGVLFRQWQMGRHAEAVGADVFHGLSNELPLSIGQFSGKKIVTIHDVIFRHRPADYGLIDRVIYDRKTAWAVRAADLVVAISRRTARDLEELYRVPPGKIRVIYQDADPLFREAPDAESCLALRRDRALPAQFFLMPGAGMPRKNALELVDAWLLLPRENRPPLVFTGPQHSAYGKRLLKKIEAAGGPRAGLLHLGSLSLPDMHCLYRLCEAVIYPSAIEGFGLPVLEALYSGKPCVARHDLGFEAWHGKGILPLSDTSPESLAEAMQHVHKAGTPAPADTLAEVFGTANNTEALIELYQ